MPHTISNFLRKFISRGENKKTYAGTLDVDIWFIAVTISYHFKFTRYKFCMCWIPGVFFLHLNPPLPLNYVFFNTKGIKLSTLKVSACQTYFWRIKWSKWQLLKIKMYQMYLHLLIFEVFCWYSAVQILCLT